MTVSRRPLRLVAVLTAFAVAHGAFGAPAWAVVTKVATGAMPLGDTSGAASSVTGSVGSHQSVALQTTSMPQGIAWGARPATFNDARSVSLTLSNPTVAGVVAAPALNLGGAASTSERGGKPGVPQAPTPVDATTPAGDGKGVGAGPADENPIFAVGPRTRRVAGRIGDVASETKGWFGRKDPGATDGVAAAAGTRSTSQAGALKPAGKPRSKGSELIAASVASQGAYESAASASLPNVIAEHFGSMAMMPDLAIAGSLASIVGRQISPAIINSMPMKRASMFFYGATFLVAAAFAGVANFGVLTPWLLFGLMITFRLLQGGSTITEATIAPAVVGEDQRELNQFDGRKQAWMEVGSVIVQSTAGAMLMLVASASTNLFVAPILYLLAMGIVLFRVHVPKEADEARMAEIRAKYGETKGGVWGIIASNFKRFGLAAYDGYKMVMHDRVLRRNVIITAGLVLFNMMTYSLLAPLFAHHFVLTAAIADPNAAAPIMTLIAAMFSFGGLFAGKFVNKQATDLKAKYGDDEATIALESKKATIRAIRIMAAAVLLVGSMALPLPALAPLVSPAAMAAFIAGILHISAASVPISLIISSLLGAGVVTAMYKQRLGLALAMIPVVLTFSPTVVLVATAFLALGGLSVVASLMNGSFFKAEVLKKDRSGLANAIAFQQAFSAFVGVLGMTALKFLFYGTLPFGIPAPFADFTGLTGIWPFVAVFAGLAVPAAIVFWSIARAQQRDLDKEIKAAQAP